MAVAGTGLLVLRHDLRIDSTLRFWEHYTMVLHSFINSLITPDGYGRYTVFSRDGLKSGKRPRYDS